MKYQCIAIIHDFYSDSDNRSAEDTTYEILKGNSIEELYDKIAIVNIENQRPVNKWWTDGCRVDLEDFVAVQDEFEFEQYMLDNCKIWQEHLKQKEQEAQLESLKKLKAKETEEKRIADKEYNLYQKLKEKYGNGK